MLVSKELLTMFTDFMPTDLLHGLLLGQRVNRLLDYLEAHIPIVKFRQTQTFDACHELGLLA